MFPLNKDQADGLAKLCFDLAKGAFVLALIGPFGQSTIGAFLSAARGFLLGIALTMCALLLLKLKEELR